MRMDDHGVDEVSGPCPCKEDVSNYKKRPEKLLEECWFFGNLLDKKTRMLRSFSDPSTRNSSNYNREDLPGKSYEETYESIMKQSRSHESLESSNLIMRAPSMPPRLERKDDNIIYPTTETEGSDPERRKMGGETSSNNLVRAPSLPTSFVADDHQEFEDEEEMEFSLGKLIRQASLNNSDAISARKHAAKVTTSTKGVTASSSVPRQQQSRRTPEMDSLKSEGSDKISPQRRLMSPLKTQKSLSALQSREFQGIKDLGFDIHDKELKPAAEISITPCFQEKKRTEEIEKKNTTRLHRTQSWVAPTPKSGAKRSTEEDMKAQIKFWARAVASNVR